MSDVRVFKDDTKEHARLRHRVRLLEKLLIGFIGLEEQLDQATTDAQADKIASSIRTHCAVVRRALFR